MLKRPLHRRPREEKNQGSLSSSLSIKHSEKGEYMHVAYCAILSSDSITHQTLPGMQKDPRISQNADSSKTTPKIASLFKTVMQAVQSAFLDSLRYLNLSVQNRNLYL